MPREGHDPHSGRASNNIRISIHVPREGHDTFLKHKRAGDEISIHVPREGHDTDGHPGEDVRAEFLSTCPVRGTTRPICTIHTGWGISIHVPREGHDPVDDRRGRAALHFYPRAP